MIGAHADHGRAGRPDQLPKSRQIWLAAPLHVAVETRSLAIWVRQRPVLLLRSVSVGWVQICVAAPEHNARETALLEFAVRQ